MRLSGQFQSFSTNAKQIIFPVLKVFVCKKPLSLFFFLHLFLLLQFVLAWFTFLCVQNFLIKKNWNCPDNLISYTTDVYPSQPAYWKLICKHLLLFVIICEDRFFLWESSWIFFICEKVLSLWEPFGISIICVNLCLYENKLVYESHHLQQIFYHQKQMTIFCWVRMFKVCVFYF